MDDLRVNTEKQEYNKKIFFQKAKKYIIKNKWWILSFILLSIIIFFPVSSGNAISNWLNNFIGTILKNTKL